MGWYKVDSRRITMERFGRPDLWIDLRKSLSMTQAEAEHIGRLAEEDPMKSLAAMIVSWHMSDPLADTEIWLPAPTIFDPSPLNNIPIEILNFIAEEMAEQQQLDAKTAIVPPANGSESGLGS